MSETPAPRPLPGIGIGRGASGAAVLTALFAVVVVTGAWHITQGTSGVGFWDLLRYALGARESVGGVPVGDVLTGSRLPRVLAGVAVGVALGTGGALLQSVTRNPLASPDTLAVTGGAYFALTVVAAFQITVPLWASGTVAFTGGILAAAVVLGLAGAGTGAASTRLILAGSAVAMALDAASATLLILFREGTTGLYAWGSGSLAQLNLDAATRTAPVIAVVLVVALLLSRRLDVLGTGDDAAASLGVPVRSTRILAVLCAVLLTGVAVTLAGPLAFVGLAAPVAVRLAASRIGVLSRHVFLIPACALAGALLVLLSDVVLRAVMGAQAAASIPTGIPTSLLGAVVIVVLALRLRDMGSAPRAHVAVRSRGRFVTVTVVVAVLLVFAATVGLLAGSLWLRVGDIGLWIQGSAPDLIARALDDRAPRVAAAVAAGAALALSGTVVQGTVRNPLAEPGILGITAGAGFGAVIVVTSGVPGGRPTLIVMAVALGLGTFALIAALSWRGGFLPDRFLLIGIGCGYALTGLSTFLLLRADPYDTPRILTWLSGTTYGRTAPDVLPVLAVLLVATPLVFGMRRQLDLLAIDEDTPQIFGVRREHARLVLLTTAAAVAAVSVIAVGVVGFVGLVAPHLARALVGVRHGRIVPVAMLIGGLLVVVADAIGRSVIAPSQIPAGLMMALIGAPYFVWLLHRSRTSA
ncbi:iron ABC transporter permease [Kineosporia succinea]|uniref:Iron complex transport system permease protein n=1 Tax=Kineosporia succinea TaxID=84632 RepID=A0ABT9PDS0_9ACTN|nr:iron ABC transporter permease [Kineosporia succinea]MDP9830861.1 iron complex transport system permease protein [Kineosporia succinea]